MAGLARNRPKLPSTTLANTASGSGDAITATAPIPQPERTKTAGDAEIKVAGAVMHRKSHRLRSELTADADNLDKDKSVPDSGNRAASVAKYRRRLPALEADA